MDRLYSLLTIKSVDDEKRIIRGIATTPEPDRVGDVVDPLGASFQAEIPLLWMHRHDEPVGVARLGKATKDGIPFEAHLPKITEPSGLSARIEEAWQSVKNLIVRGISIGFMPKEWSIIEATGGMRFTQCEIYELSLVTVPANAAASITTIKSIDSQIRQAAAGQGADKKEGLEKTAGAPAKPVKLNPTAKEAKTMKYGEQIKAAQATRTAKIERQKALMDKSKEEGATLDAAEKEEFDGIEKDLTELDAHIKRLESLQARDIETATPIEKAAATTEQGASDARSSQPIVLRKKLEKGVEFAQFVQVMAASKGQVGIAKNLAERFFPDSKNLAGVMKAAVSAASTTDAAWAGNLVEYREISSDFVDYLRPRTIIGQMGKDGVPALRRIPFNVHIKGQSVKATAGWVGEGKAKPVTEAGFTDTNLGFAKIAGILVATDEMLRFGIPGTQELLRDTLADAVIEQENLSLIDPDVAAVANVSPASLLNGVTPIDGTATDVQSVVCAIDALWTAGDAANYPVQNAFYVTDVATARALASMRYDLSGERAFPNMSVLGGNIDGVPVIVSNYVPSDTGGSIFALVYASEVWLADDGVVTIDVSKEASILMDSAPNMNSTTPTAAQMVSMFQTNSVAIRAEKYINWAKRRPLAAAYLNNVNWNFCGNS